MSLFFVKVQVFGLQHYLKINSFIDIFKWFAYILGTPILRNTAWLFPFYFEVYKKYKCIKRISVMI